MKYFLNTFICCFILQLSAFGQADRCQTVIYTQKKIAENPALKTQLAKQNAEFDRYLKEGNVRPSSVITIPVVFHIIYNTPEQNVPDSRVLEQLDVLNKDYSRMNQDAQSTPSVFESVGAGTNIQFCLAKRDPNNVPTSGIERKYTSTQSFDISDDMKKTAIGGLKGWTKNKYLNIWVCNLRNNLLGYASSPGVDNDSTDGVVVSFTTVGGPNAVGTNTTYNLGRTVTHEVGHWLNLIHIWGDDGNSCSGSDSVADTPNQAGPDYGTPNFPTITCNNGPDGNMFMNYLDYSDDFVMNIFTAGQSARMNAALTALRPTLLTSNGCVDATAATDLQLVELKSASGVFCSDSISPVAVVKNKGTSVITAITFSTQPDDNTPLTKSWTGSLAAGQTTTVPLNKFVVSEGTHYLNVKAAVAGDLNLSNNNLVNYFYVSEKGTPLPYSQNFENKRFPADSWKMDNPDNKGTWMRTRLAASSGSASLWIYDSSNTQTVGIQIEPLDLTSITEPILAFDLAYRHVPFLSSSHTLKISASTDCGTTYSEIYSKSDEELATVTENTNTFFIPTEKQWRKDTISLKPFAPYNSVILKFENISGNSNSLYIDSIQVNNLAGIFPDASDINIKLLENPIRNKLQFSVFLLKAEEFRVDIFDVAGKLVYRSEYKGNQVEATIHLPELQQGVYLFRVTADNKTKSKKFICL